LRAGTATHRLRQSGESYELPAASWGSLQSLWGRRKPARIRRAHLRAFFGIFSQDSAHARGSPAPEESPRKRVKEGACLPKTRVAKD